MNELDAWGEELRNQLGEPPAGWPEQQRRRLRDAQLHDRRHRLVLPLSAVAAVAGLLALVVYWTSFRPTAENSRENAVAGVLLDAELASVPYRTGDGSTIQLEIGSQGRFSKASKGVRFDLHHGRGHFHVTKLPHQDWTVVAGRYAVHVVGTRFSVSYGGDGNLGVWVEEGRVAVQVPERNEPVVLRAGDRLRVHDDKLSLDVRSNDRSSSERNAEEASAQGRAPKEATSKPAITSQRSLPTIAKTPTAAGQPRGWHDLYKQGEYAAALSAAKSQGFRRLAQTLPAQRLIELADAARLGGDSQAALAALSALESRFPGSAAASDAGFLIGRLHAQRGESAAAIRRFTAYLQRGEDSKYALEAMGRLVELHVASGNTGAARALAERYLQRAPTGPYQRLAESVVERR